MIPARAGKLRAFSTRNRTLAARAGTGRGVAFPFRPVAFPVRFAVSQTRVSSSRDVARQTHFASFAVFRLVETQGAPRVHARSSIYVNLRVRWCNRVSRAVAIPIIAYLQSVSYIHVASPRPGGDGVPRWIRDRVRFYPIRSQGGLVSAVCSCRRTSRRTPAFVSRHPLRSPNYTPVLSPLDLTLDPSLVSRVTSQSPPAHGVVGLEQRTTTE